MGVDYVKAEKADADKPCIDDDGNANGNCKASCEFVEGRYDCWSFPCLNGAYCLDGVDTYTCYCKDGYTGTNCQKDIDECTILDPAVCDPSADCINYPGGYSCSCRDGWEGDGFTNNTDVPIPAYAKTSLNTRVAPGCSDLDDCVLRPCWHGGACTDEGTLSYECDCLHGWVGAVCDTDIDECTNGQGNCATHAECSNTPGSFECICGEGWTGDGREGPKPDEEALFGGCVDRDDCHKCANGGTCYDLGGGTGLFTCECVFGWEGDTCERDFDECHPSSEEVMSANGHTLMECDTHAQCANTPGSYGCECDAGYTGDGLACVDADDCEFTPCNNGGTCMDCGILCFVCDCTAGWRGRSCQEDWDECKLGIHTCHNDAQCSNTPGSYECICDEGYSGDGFSFCVDVDDCVEYLPGEDPAIYTDDIVRVDADGNYLTPCGSYDEAQDLFYKHGECKNLDAPNIFACTCAEGWTDYNCDRDVNECSGLNSCHRFADCRNVEGSYECDCQMGYTGSGRQCHDIDDCIGAPCEHGVCSDVGTEHYTCRCYPGYTDVNCDYDVNECGEKSHECHPDATCSNTVGSYACQCNGGYEGNGVTECHDEDDCASSPCQSGTCVDEGDSAYACVCFDGWMDTKCDQDVNECFLGTHDCLPDLAKCLNSPGSFYCRCFAGYVGDGRECIDLDDCDPDPCAAGYGECVDLGQHAYVCDCEDGYSGERCTMDVDECTMGSHACSTHAHCLNQFGTYVCDCFAGHFGDGESCGLCTKCPEGWAETAKCGLTDRECENMNECALQSDNCHVNAQCTDTLGSFLCECRNDPLALSEQGTKLWTGDGTQCKVCTECGEGYIEILPCTSTQDRTCKIAVREGLYYISTTAGGNSQCLVMGLTDEDVFPYRYNWGYGNTRQLCGIGDWNGLSPKENLMQAGIAVWKLQQIKGDYYTVENNARGKGYTCLAYPHESLPYPQLFSWGRDGADNCGINENGVSAMDSMLGQKSAVWRIVPLDGNSVLLQSNTRSHGWECIGFADHGMATNPSRLDFGSMSADQDDKYCHIQRGPLENPVPKLMVDQRAVFELNWLGPLEGTEESAESVLSAFEARQEAELEKRMDDTKHARGR